MLPNTRKGLPNTSKELRKTSNRLRKEEEKMSSVAEAQSIMRDVWPTTRTGSVQGSVSAAYRFMRKYITDREFTYRRVETIWQGKAPYVISQEMDALRAAEIKEARHEQSEIHARLATLNARLAVVDAEFHSETLSAQDEQIRRDFGGDS